MRRMPILCRNYFLWAPEDVLRGFYAVLVGISSGYPPAKGRLHTCYSPVRRSPADEASFIPAAPRLACVKPVASVHPEPGSNSSLLLILFFFFSKKFKASIFKFYCLSQALTIPFTVSRSSSAFLYWVSAVQNWLETCAWPTVAGLRIALVLLLVYCNRFNVLFRCIGSFPDCGCKVTPSFLRHQIFSGKSSRKPRFLTFVNGSNSDQNC